MTTWRHSIQMSEYGGDTAKPTWLYSLQEAISELDLFKSSTPRETARPEVSLVKTYVNPHGEVKCCGSAALKGSQAYPEEFGYACSRLYERCRLPLLRRYSEELGRWTAIDPTTLPAPAPSWEDAELDEVLRIFR